MILSCTCKMKVDTHKSVGVYFFGIVQGKECESVGKKGTPHKRYGKEERMKVSAQ